jgi:predicted HAD superfamily Cof-like phosphohydrolase
MVLPLPGTPAHDEFMRKARDPNSTEAKILQQLMGDASAQAQDQVRKMLHTMIELVPGQLFRDIGRFHNKFKLEPTEDPGHRLPDDVLAFRLNFLIEELQEYARAVGHPVIHLDESGHTTMSCEDEFDPELAFDALIDLVYVALGTAFLHRFPFNEGWARVQEANMAKVRADGSDDARSHRKHSADVVKPEGWKAPVLSDLLGPKQDEAAVNT